MTTQIFKVNGMSCGGCVASVEKILRAQRGVKTVRVDLSAATATLEADPSTFNPVSTRKVMEAASYTFTAVQTA